MKYVLRLVDLAGGIEVPLVFPTLASWDYTFAVVFSLVATVLFGIKVWNFIQFVHQEDAAGCETTL